MLADFSYRSNTRSITVKDLCVVICFCSSLEVSNIYYLYVLLEDVEINVSTSANQFFLGPGNSSRFDDVMGAEESG